MAADSALGMLAELAAMKAGAASTAMTWAGGDDSDEDDKKKKKKKAKKKKTTKKSTAKKSTNDKTEKASKPKKGKKGKRKSAAPVSITDELEEALGAPEEEEKTPEPPANLSEIEKRKFRLKYARKKLAKRKRQREEQKKHAMGGLGALLSSSSTAKEMKFGKEYIAKFMKELQSEQSLIHSKIVDVLQEEEEEEKAAKQRAKQEQQEEDLLSGLGLSADAASKRKKEQMSKEKSLYRKPGRVNVLSVADEVHFSETVEKKVQCADKEVMTDASMFENYLREEFGDDFKDRDGNQVDMNIKVVAGLVESQIKYGYPRELWEVESAESPSPSPTAQKIRRRKQVEDARKAKQMELKEQRKREREAEMQRRQNMAYMSRKDANQLIKNGEFLENFRKKTKWIERTLGINMEYMEMEDDGFGDDYDYDEEDEEELDEEKKEEEEDEVEEEEEEEANGMKPQKQQKQARGRKKGGKGKANLKQRQHIGSYLKFRKKFEARNLNGRAVGNIDFSQVNQDWFAASYFVSGHSHRFGTDSKGCIAIWNLMLPTYPEYTLSAQNMITSTYFHPTDAFFIFGSTMNGQILMWDLRQNSGKPMQRSNFSNGHSAPVFSMSFLPNIAQKQAEIAKKRGKVLTNLAKQNKSASSSDVQHVLSVSNDGKLCIWRTDQLSVKPVNQSILKPPDDQSTARQIELITTCFDFTYRDHANVVLGSDEGYLYKAEIFSQNSSSDQSLSIKESINAHYGPITAVNFFPIQYFGAHYNFKENVTGLYLTSSYDWTVKLWHNKIGTKIDMQSMKSSSLSSAATAAGHGTATATGSEHNVYNGPLAVFDQMTDYVYDVKWNTGGKPGVFACCDGEAQINLFDLTRDFRHPLLQTLRITDKKNVAATTLSWTRDGKYLACGDSNGAISFYNVHKSISRQTLRSCELLQSVANKYVVQV
eukprot:CAMPEP_0197024020 /NCGR_PEP_ID=MMETSP1384-20130603/4677_1 /TAXON_ID=29189 /ORGANISM="Ammonia sp." /LENGTH=934 /DNA_ID=CAMNT_0042452347 /DNA_START=10 /DNA_END=2814 /DNA_ORIENTATION=-